MLTDDEKVPSQDDSWVPRYCPHYRYKRQRRQTAAQRPRYSLLRQADQLEKTTTLNRSCTTIRRLNGFVIFEKEEDVGKTTMYKIFTATIFTIHKRDCCGNMEMADSRNDNPSHKRSVYGPHNNEKGTSW